MSRLIDREKNLDYYYCFCSFCFFALMVLSPFLFSIVLNILSEDGRKGALYELLYADDGRDYERTRSTIHPLEGILRRERIEG